jgi:hypothetical protein
VAQGAEGPEGGAEVAACQRGRTSHFTVTNQLSKVYI